MNDHIFSLVENNLEEIMNYLIQKRKIRLYLEDHEIPVRITKTDKFHILMGYIPAELRFKIIQEYQIREHDLLRFI